MSGLLEKALHIQREAALRAAEENRNGKKYSEAETGISSEEHEQLVAEIEKLFVNRPIVKESVHIHAGERNNGVKFLLTVNALAVLVLVLSVFIYGTVRRASSEEIASVGEGAASTQARILEEMKRQTEEELGARENRISDIQSELENMRRLRASDPTGTTVVTVADPRQAELERELAALQSDTSSLLKSLAERRERQTFLIRQLQSLYRNVDTHVAFGRLSDASAALEGADRILNDIAAVQTADEAPSAPALRSANNVLSRLVSLQRASAENTELAVAASRIDELSRIVRQADTAFTSGNLQEAAALYTRALGAVDSASHAYTRLRDLTRTQHQEEVSRLGGEIAVLRSSLASMEDSSRDLERNLAEYVRERDELRLLSAEQTVASENLRSRIEERTAELETQRTRVLSLTRSVESGIRNLEEKTRALVDAGGQAPPRTAELLDTKVTLREIAGSEIIRINYPELYTGFDAFFDNYGTMYSRLGREQAVQDIISAINQTITTLEDALRTDR